MIKSILIQFIAIAAVLVSMDAAIPDYIHVCRRHDPNISNCVKNSVEDLRVQLTEGIPELDVPPIDPLHIDKMALSLGPGINAEGVNLKLSGGKNFRIDYVDVDIKADTYSFGVSIPEIVAEGNYTIDATIASIPLKGHGPLVLIAKSISGQGKIHGKKVFKGSQTLYWFPGMSLQLKIADYDMQLQHLFEGNKVLGQVVNDLLNDQKEQVLTHILPGIERVLVDHILLCANNMCKHFHYPELFLDD